MGLKRKSDIESTRTGRCEAVKHLSVWKRAHFQIQSSDVDDERVDILDECQTLRSTQDNINTELLLPLIILFHLRGKI